jgi:anti-sigma factor RsiW
VNEQIPSELAELHAYVDEQLSPEARQRVETRLANDSEARREVEDYAAISKGIRSLYDPVLKEPVPATMRRRPLPWRLPLGAIAASVFLLVTGAWIGMHLKDSALLQVVETPHVVREAAMAYAVYTPEVRHPVDVPGDQEEHLLAWLTKRLGAQVRAPKLEDLGFLLVGGRLISSDDGPGALFMYENGDGRRIVLYMCENENDGRSTSFRFASDEGVSVFYWFDGPFSYALAGELDRDGMASLAEAVYNQIVI